MLNILKWIGGIALVAALGFAATVYWFFYDNRMPREGAFSLGIAELRSYADVVPGDKPLHIEVETTSTTPAPKMAMVAGSSWEPVDMVRNSFRVVYPDGSVMIETGHSRDEAMQFGATQYDDAAWERILAEVQSADKILITHGHPDHAGGLFESLSDKARGAAQLSDAQIGVLSSKWSSASSVTPTLRGGGFQAVAPGIVVVPAPGHTPGSQLIYVQLDSGDEYLFTGDTASMLENITTGNVRSRYVMTRIGADDRAAVMRQTDAIRTLAADNPTLILVPGHDAIHTRTLIDERHLVKGFQTAAIERAE